MVGLCLVALALGVRPRQSNTSHARSVSASHIDSDNLFDFVLVWVSFCVWSPYVRPRRSLIFFLSKTSSKVSKQATMADEGAASAATADLDMASAKVEAMDIEEKKDEDSPEEPAAAAAAAAATSMEDDNGDAGSISSLPDLENAGDDDGDDEIESGSTDDDDGDDDDEDKGTPPADPTVAIVEAMTQKEEGNAAFKEGDFTAAVRSYRKGTTLLKPFNKNNTGDEQVKSLLLTLQTNLSMVCFKQDKHKMSRDVASKALEIDPINVKALYRRAVAYRKLGDAESARSDLREALKHEPNNKAVRKELMSIKKDVEASRAKEKERLQKAFGANKGGSSFLYNDKEEEERRKAEEKKKQEEAEAEALKKRKIVSWKGTATYSIRSYVVDDVAMEF